jgi:hypothetical protein
MAADPHVVVDLLWLVGDLVAAPVVYMQQVAALREGVPDSPVRDALERWDQGYCPACGSWPALAEFFFGERLLRCAFCAATWRPPAAPLRVLRDDRRRLQDDCRRSASGPAVGWSCAGAAADS